MRTKYNIKDTVKLILHPKYIPQLCCTVQNVIQWRIKTTQALNEFNEKDACFLG